jgi:hypothetical protein
MSTDLERRLRAALHEDARRARLVHPDSPPHLQPRTSPEGEAPRRSARFVAAAAAIALIAAVAVAVLRDRDPAADVDVISPPDRRDEQVSTDTTLGPAELFADFPPGATVELPPAPVSERATPATVWSGTEIIVWGGMDAAGGTLGDGAAFDPASDTWRVIAPAPIDPRIGAEAAWTGTEMLVWGGTSAWSGGRPLEDGAAYDPETDTWRPLADGPFGAWDFGAASVWTGDELVVIGVQPDPPASERKPMAAYDPATDEWRELADVPNGTDFDLVWTGERLLTTVTGYSSSTGEGTSTEVWSYDIGRDRWDRAAGLESVDVSLLPVMEADGSVRAVLALGHETGTSITVLDGSGNATGTLPAIPGDPATLGDMSASGAVWLGDEGVFWIRRLGSEDEPEHWALSWSTRTWRSLRADEVPPLYYELTPVPGAGVLIGFSGVTPEDGGATSGVVYRPPSPPGG